MILRRSGCLWGWIRAKKWFYGKIFLFYRKIFIFAIEMMTVLKYKRM